MLASETIDDFINKLDEYGITATLNNGKLNFDTTGNLINGGIIADNLGINFTLATGTVTSVNSSASVLFTTTVNTTASTDTTISALGVSDGSFNIFSETNSIIATGSISNDKTIGDVIATLENYGFQAYMLDGVIKISSMDNNYITGALANGLHLSTTSGTYVTTNGANTTSTANIAYTSNSVSTTTTTATMTSGVTQTSSLVVTYTTTVNVTGSTKLADIGVSNGNWAIINSASGNMVASGSISSDKTIQELLNQWNSQGVTATISNGVISVNSNNGKYVTGAIANELGIQTAIAGVNTIIIGGSLASNGEITFVTTVNNGMTTVKDIATGATMLNEITGLNSNSLINITDQSGNITDSFVVSGTTTMNELVSALQDKGFNASFANGVLTVESSIGKLITGEVPTLLGIRETMGGASNKVQTSYTAALKTYMTKQVAATSSSKLKEYITFDGAVETAKNYTITGTIAVDGTIYGGNVIGISTAEDLVALANAKIVCSGDKYLLACNGWNGIEVLTPRLFCNRLQGL